VPLSDRPRRGALPRRRGPGAGGGTSATPFVANSLHPAGSSLGGLLTLRAPASGPWQAITIAFSDGLTLALDVVLFSDNPLSGVPLQSSVQLRDERACVSVPRRSGGDLEQLANEGGLSLHVPAANPVNLPLPHHPHRFIARQRSSCCMETAKAQPRSNQALHPAVVLLHDVVQVFDRPQARKAP
jgi:hypothetical protein